MSTAIREDHPVVVIGAGPVGLAAAAHLADRGMLFLVLEAGDDVGAAVSEWGHIRTFTPWQYIVDATAEELLAPTGWARPSTPVPPTGAELVEHYLRPLPAELQSRGVMEPVSSLRVSGPASGWSGESGCCPVTI